MLIVHRMHAGAPRYHLAAVGPGGGDAPRRGEAPGYWAGAGAAARGLSGEVDGGDLRALLPAGAGRVRGFDLTFAAPKSVSVLHALGSDPVSAAVRMAHDDAVAAALAYLERHACAVRVGGRVVAAGGFVAAAFRHRVSRAGDPHLHSHVLVANVGAAADGRWRALHTPLLYAERRGAQATYHAVLRGRLTASLGVRWGVPTGGRSDMLEVPADVRSAFSRRRAAVLAAAAGSVSERRWAERVTRPERDGLVDHDGVVVEWRRRVEALGWAMPALGAGRAADHPDVDDGLLPASDRWTRAALMVALADHFVDGATEQELRHAADRLLASPEVIPVTRGAPEHGVTAVGLQAAARFTTRTALARAQAVAAALEGRVVDGDAAALDAGRRRLAADGRRMLLVAVDGPGADLLQARTGVPAMAAAEAARAVPDLRPGDVVVLTRVERLASLDVEAVLAAAATRGVHLVAATRESGPSRGPGVAPRGVESPGLAHPGVAPAGVAMTVAVAGGDVTASSTAMTAVDTAIGDWVARRSTSAAAVLVAEPDEVAALNARAREALRAVGVLDGPEVGGFGAGDVVRFTHGRPARGIARHAHADVVAAHPDRGRLDLRMEDGRPLQLRAADLRGVVHAHVVPPVPALVAGRGDVFVIGGRSIAPRHLEGAQLHRYVTVDAALLSTRQWAPGLAREERRSGPTQRAAAATEWLAMASERLARAEAVGDRDTAAVWRAQVAAAGRARTAALAERAVRPPAPEVTRSRGPGREPLSPRRGHGTDRQHPLAARSKERDTGLAR